MKIAVEYTLTGSSWGVRIGDATASSGTRTIAPQSSGAGLDAPGAYRVGGNLQPPKKIKDVAPVYPPIAQEARVQGVVILEARIDENGNISDTRILAIDAVKQWQYTPTLMNGVAVPIIMTTTVNFTLRKLIQLQVVLPDGSSGGIDMPGNILLHAPGGRFQLRASPAQEPNDVTVSVFSEDGQTNFGEVTLTMGGPVVQTPTTPSLGLQFLGIR